MTELNRPKEAWGTRIGVILAVTGSAVGLGNYLRFPGLAAKYEGGAFMIPYFVALLLLGIPMAWAEWALGRYGGTRGFNSSPGIYRAIWKSKAAPYVGALSMLVPVGIYMYYVVIEAWCLAYTWFAINGSLELGTDKAKYNDFFNGFVGMGGHGTLGQIVWWVAACFLINFVLIYRGLAKGIEWFCNWAMPALFLCSILVLIRVLTLGTPDPTHPELNVNTALGFMWNPRTGDKTLWESLANPQMWMDAAGQIFFTLSVGFGIIVNYASYVKKDDDIALSALTSNAANEISEVGMGGMITIPAAFLFLGVVGAAEAATSGTFSLGFKTLPMVFEMMPLGRVVSILWFGLLFLAALAASVSMLQPAIALLEEGLGIGRKASVTMLGFMTAIGAMFVLYFSRNLVAMDTMDFWVGTFCIYILATFQVILFGWVLGIRRGYQEIQQGAEMRVPYWMMFVIKFVCPTYLLIIFGLFIHQQLTTENNYFTALAKDRYAQIAVGLLVMVLIFFLLIIASAVRRWRRQEANGERPPIGEEVPARGFEVVR